MRLRLRLILSFLIMAVIPLLFIVLQVSFGFARYIKSANDGTSRMLGDLTRGSETIARTEVVRMLTENQAVYDKALASIRFSLAIMTALLFFTMVGLGILLAYRFSSPFERLAVISTHLLQLVRRAAGSRDRTGFNRRAGSFLYRWGVPV